MKQLIPSSLCLACDICCRFTEQNSRFRPFFSFQEKQRLCKTKPDLLRTHFFSLSEKPGEKIISTPSNKENYQCPFFSRGKNTCTIYDHRPLDCILYPFMLMYDQSGQRILLCLDPQCAFLRTLHVSQEGNNIPDSLHAYIQELSLFLESGKLEQDTLLGIISEYQETLIVVQDLPLLSQSLIHPELGLKKFKSQILPELSRFLHTNTQSFTRHLPYHLLWSDFFHYLYTVIKDHLCLFALHDGTIFMPTPPIGPHLSADLIRQCEDIMHACILSPTGHVHIENLISEECALFAQEGFRIREKGNEYLYPTAQIATYSGGLFKKKRLYAHYCQNHLSARMRPFTQEDTLACLNLYLDWATSKQKYTSDAYARYLMEDSLYFHKRLFAEYVQLGITGRVLESEGTIIGYTFGCAISKDTFCILAEITDHSKRGASEYLFQHFCQEHLHYPWINTMDDSELILLKKAKYSYHPSGISPLLQAVKGTRSL